jgi:hypothetical protein
MKLQIEGMEPKDVVKVSLMQDGPDINILINNQLVAYFNEASGRLHLELVSIPTDSRCIFDLDESNCIEVRS